MKKIFLLFVFSLLLKTNFAQEGKFQVSTSYSRGLIVTPYFMHQIASSNKFQVKVQLKNNWSVLINSEYFHIAQIDSFYDIDFGDWNQFRETHIYSIKNLNIARYIPLGQRINIITQLGLSSISKLINKKRIGVNNYLFSTGEPKVNLLNANFAMGSEIKITKKFFFTTSFEYSISFKQTEELKKYYFGFGYTIW